MKPRKNKTTPETRAFWASVERTAKIVDSWPAWKRGEELQPAPLAAAARRRDGGGDAEGS